MWWPWRPTASTSLPCAPTALWWPGAGMTRARWAITAARTSTWPYPPRCAPATKPRTPAATPPTPSLSPPTSATSGTTITVRITAPTSSSTAAWSWPWARTSAWSWSRTTGCIALATTPMASWGCLPTTPRAPRYLPSPWTTSTARSSCSTTRTRPATVWRPPCPAWARRLSRLTPANTTASCVP